MCWHPFRNATIKDLRDQNTTLKTQNDNLQATIDGKKWQAWHPLENAKDWQPANLVSLYTAYLDHWTTARDERKDYNKFFITLLFTDILVAVLGSIVSSIKLTQPTGNDQATKLVLVFPQALAVIVFVVATLISLVWVLKLHTLNHRDNDQIDALMIMEKCLPVPFRSVEAETKNQIRDLSTLRKHFSWHGLGDVLNYYLISWCALALFLVLSLLAAFNKVLPLAT